MRRPKDNHAPECTCSRDYMPHVDNCACCDCGLADRRQRDNDRKRERRATQKAGTVKEKP